MCQQNAHRTLIIDYPNMRSGGIETMLAYLIHYALEHEVRVLWITSSYLYPLASYQDIIDYSKVECLVSKPWKQNLMILPKIKVNSNDDVIIFSATPLRYIATEKYRTKLRAKNFRHYLCIPNFEGESCFPDSSLKNRWIKGKIHKFLSNSLQKIEDNDALRGFNVKHLDEYEKYYNIKIQEKEKKIIPTNRPDIEMRDENLYKKAADRQSGFKIITCSRFEFPHKGYLIGLLQAYAKIKEKYSKVSLTIIGYGGGQDEMKKLISSFPTDVVDSIKFMGMLSHSQTMTMFQESHLFIGLAGAAGDAARCSLPTLLVRHYSYSCETYGFYFNTSDKILSCDKGDDIQKYIAKVILMDDDTYVLNCKRTKQESDKKRNYNPNYFFEQKSQKRIFDFKDELIAYVINLILLFRRYFHKLKVQIEHLFKKARTKK